MKILYCGDSPTVNTGFGVVSKNLLKGFVELGHKITVLGVNHFGDPYDQKEFPYPIHPVDKGSMPEQIFGLHKLWYLEQNLKPDVVFFLNDPWIIDQYMDTRPPKPSVPHQKTIAYFPTDAGPLKKKWAKRLTEDVDVQVCYSNFAERVIIDANEGIRPKNLYQIYHGVDTKMYHPVHQGTARSELGIPQDAFVIGMVARNQYRKRFDILMKAFADFAADKPEAKLYLHTATKDIGFDIMDLAQQFNLNEKLILTKDISAAQGVSEQRLNLIYNTFDVNALISLGDGFGLPVAESMATGCVQLVSGHSCLKELVEGHGGLTVKTAAWTMTTAGINTWGGVSDVTDLTVKMNLLYNNKDLRIRLSEDGYRFITQDKFTWGAATRDFHNIIKSLFHLL